MDFQFKKSHTVIKKLDFEFLDLSTDKFELGAEINMGVNSSNVNEIIIRSTAKMNNIEPIDDGESGMVEADNVENAHKKIKIAEITTDTVFETNNTNPNLKHDELPDEVIGEMFDTGLNASVAYLREFLLKSYGTDFGVVEKK
ncbi:hypothetical protein ACOJIU_17765 (plasmid) [Carnobacterium maltaromaticum]|uniref:hypothetical protein n=1 Tax=Carnobacterium maltaromaticum TaxID=2751 RepID=UPI003450A578